MTDRDFSSLLQGYRRFEKAMTGIPDRVPLFAQLHEFAMKERGAAAREFYTNPGLLVSGTLETQALMPQHPFPS